MIDSGHPAVRPPSSASPSRPADGHRRVRQAVGRAIAAWRAPAPPERSGHHHARKVDPEIRRFDRTGDVRVGAAAHGREPLRRGPATGEPGVMAPLPRRTFLTVRIGETTPPMMRFVAFRTSYVRALLRLLVWVHMCVGFGGRVFWDELRRRNTPAQRAVRLRQAFERTGGSFIKIGQHLAMRLDVLRWEYGAELSRMLDRLPPFPLDRAIAMVERAMGRPLAETYARFDPEPVGSTSIACVYQAVLLNGEKVVVKVRRPGIGELFMADVKVFDWLAAILEFLTVLRPGSTRSMRRELRETLVEELNFVQQARSQDSFRRAAAKSGRTFFTAPRVHFELSSEDVIVQEFVSGMWLWELVAAVEQDNAEVLALARRLEIDPRRIARRLAWINYWGWHEHLFFRADPHPDHVIIGAGGTLTFIDFSAIGAIDRTKRRALQQNMYYASKRDPLSMARAALALLEPLPPVDVIDLTKELEACNWQMLYAFEARQSGRDRRERTSALQWLGLIRLAHRYDITIDFHILRLLRGSVLCDTLAIRLDPAIDVLREYRRFARYRAGRARRRARRNLSARLSKGFDQTNYLRLERLAQTGESFFFRLRHALSMPAVNFSALMSKWSFAAYTLIRFATQVLAVTAIAVAGVAAAQYLAAGESPDLHRALGQVVRHPLYLVVLVLLLFINGRALLFRMDDRDA